MTQHRQSTRIRTSTKRGVQEAGERARQHGLPVVVVARSCFLAHMPCVPPAPDLRFSFAAFRLSARFFSILAAVLSLKEHVSRLNSSHPYPSTILNHLALVFRFD